jgi:hypothetical protein
MPLKLTFCASFCWGGGWTEEKWHLKAREKQEKWKTIMSKESKALEG